MNKQSLLAALNEQLRDIPDDVNIIIDCEGPIKQEWQLKIQQVCGGRQKYMVYFCVLKAGHAGDCWCACKDVDFKKEDF